MDAENRDVLKSILLMVVFFTGAIMCAMCAVGFFVSSDFIAEAYYGASKKYSGYDSDAASFLYSVEMYMLRVTAWLKGLSMTVKIAGMVIGGIMMTIGSDWDD